MYIQNKHAKTYRRAKADSTAAETFPKGNTGI